MKRIRTLTTSLLLSTLMLFVQSCLEEDAYDNIMNSPMNSNPALGTLITPSQKTGEAVIENDNGGCTYVVNTEVLTRADANHEGQRLFYQYVTTQSPFGEQDSKGPYIRITDLLKILTKPIDILKADETDVYGQDGIALVNHKLSKQHLTLQFQVMRSSSNIAHRISLVVAEGAAPDLNGYLSVELRHHAEGDQPTSISSPSYVSFVLTHAPGYEDGTLKGYKLTYKDLNNKTQTILIAPNSESKSLTSFVWEDAYNTQTK